jgi:hypothetical protein
MMEGASPDAHKKRREKNTEKNGKVKGHIKLEKGENVVAIVFVR